ncbi:Trans-resveratrol di-O-methyltransferase [Morella rubra]|uniref:Trans-resveratrol di-O-methyltransferase n=1 Tax=Morella rubra TaxID=262757 RepID=A0A6A1VBF8_9ROSI|nr:Trans-resveratrol di-O-methyltransferase [Morella rubra]
MSGFRQLSFKLVPGRQGTELLHAQAHTWNHILSFAKSMSLKCAVQLGIPDIIHNHGKPMTFSELIAALPIHPSKAGNVYRLMRFLVHSGVFAEEKSTEIDQEEGYLLTGVSRLLLKDDPLSLTPLLLFVLDPDMTKPWHHLTSWLQNDDPMPFDTAHGMTMWDYEGCDPKMAHLFQDAMASDTRLVISVVIDKCSDVLEGLESLVDVGGSSGTMTKAITDAFPNIECTVLDLPHVVAGLQDNANLKYVGGDMFEAVPPADAVLLKWILHDWNDEECVKILQKCKEAITRNGKKGKVIIIEMMVGNQKGDKDSTETQLFFDMLMMALVKGKERNEKEWAKLFYDAGFTDYKIKPILGLRSLIEVYP